MECRKIYAEGKYFKKKDMREKAELRFILLLLDHSADFCCICISVIRLHYVYIFLVFF